MIPLCMSPTEFIYFVQVTGGELTLWSETVAQIVMTTGQSFFYGFADGLWCAY